VDDRAARHGQTKLVGQGTHYHFGHEDCGALGRAAKLDQEPTEGRFDDDRAGAPSAVAPEDAGGDQVWKSQGSTSAAS
jgi:hypothetical protein